MKPGNRPVDETRAAPLDETRATDVGETRASNFDAPAPTSGGDATTGPLGFDLPIEQWMERVREAQVGAKLGRLGGYDLLDEVGRGGQGIVYRARQLSTGRVVAVKRLLHGAYANAAMRRRFGREVAATTTLNHPNIVTVYGVETVDEMPMLVMEWIDGLPLNRWVGQRIAAGRGGFSSDDIVRAFLQVCDAVQHAHQRGIIHRDLKPSNILVGVDGKPHILDFGLAKFIEQDANQPQMTMSSEFVGTPAYAAPEQVRGEVDKVDTRTDVYALGLILYELLTGVLPFINEPNLAAMLQAILNKEPPPPRSITPRLDRELEIILLKAIEKDPAKRFNTVDALGGDLRRYLAGEPITAHPPSPLYLAQKLLRRYRVAVGFVSAMFVLLVAFAVFASIQNLRLQQQKDESDSRWASSDVVLGFVQEMFRRADQAHRGDEPPGVATMLEQAAERVPDEITRADSAAELHLLVGSGFARLGRFAEAEAQLQLGLDRDAAVPHPNPKRTLLILHELSHVLLREGKPAEARPLLAKRYDLARQSFGETNAETVMALTTLCDVIELQGDKAALVQTLTGGVERLLRQSPAETPNALLLVARLAAALVDGERFDEAERWYARIDAAMPRVGSSGVDIVLSAQRAGAAMQLRRGRGDAAVASLQRTLTFAAERLPRGDWRIAVVRRDYAIALWHTQRDQDAERQLLGAYSDLTAALGDTNPETQATIRAIIDILEGSNRPEKAEQFRELLAEP